MLVREEWREQTRNVGGEEPNPEKGDVVYQVTTGGMNFAGLRVVSNAWIGVKLVVQNGDDSSRGGLGIVFPEYQLVYIKDEQTVEGPKVLVWIFHKLTGKRTNTASSSSSSSSSNSSDNEGNGKRNDDKSTNQQSVSSFSRFYVQTTQDKEIIFTIESMLDIAVKFPSFLLKILPVSKEKAEEQGSASVMKTLLKDTAASLERVVEFYREVSLVQNQMI